MIDFQSQSWFSLATEIQKLRASESLKLEDVKQNFNDTQFIRGKIAAYKDLLALPKKAAAQVTDDRPE